MLLFWPRLNFFIIHSFIIASIFSTLLFENKYVYADNIIRGCSSHCTLNFDKTLNCWNKTLEFFELVLLGQLNQYTAIQASRAILMQNQNWSVDYKKMRDETIAHMMSEPPLDIEDEKGIEDKDVFLGVIGSLINNTEDLVAMLSGKNLTTTNIFNAVACPVACEHDWDPFFWLFFASGGLNLLLVGFILLLVWLLDRRDSKYSMMEDLNEVVKLKKQKHKKRKQVEEVN